MKNLIIPAECDNSSINITDINNEFNGLIIAYKNNMPFCYIQYNNQWEYNFTINSEYSENWDDTLINLIKNLNEEEPNLIYKVIEFAK